MSLIENCTGTESEPDPRPSPSFQNRARQYPWHSTHPRPSPQTQIANTLLRGCKKLLIHNTQQSSHTNSTVYRPCKNNNLSTDSVDSIFLRSSSVRPAREMNVRMVCSLLVCTVKCMGSGIPMHAHRARGVPASC